jgi:hypothetical protein
MLFNLWVNPMKKVNVVFKNNNYLFCNLQTYSLVKGMEFLKRIARSITF